MDTNISLQVQELEKNSIHPIEIRVKANMIVVRRDELEKATALKMFPEITIASRY